MFSTLGTPPPEAQADTERPAALIRSALKACAPTIFIWNTPAIFELAARGSNARRDRFANFLRCKGDALARTFYEFLLTIDAAQKTRAITECGIDRTLWRLDRIIPLLSLSAGHTRTHWKLGRANVCTPVTHAQLVCR